jgi:DNA-binding CsgD family transcriptional regulator
MIKLENENRKKVFCLILQGYSPAEIPEELGISKKAVERFKYDILEILTLEINVTNNRFR